MTEKDEVWDLFWEMHLQAMQGLGKREAILAVSKLIRRLTNHAGSSLRLLELGCGEGQILGTLLDAHLQDCSVKLSVGLDRDIRLLNQCRQDFPRLRLVQGDFTDHQLLSNLGQFEIVLLVNTLHEVYSDSYSQELDEIDIPAAKIRVKKALASVVERIAPGGYLVLFDGLEPPGSGREQVRIRFHHSQARDSFLVFAREYLPFRISYRVVGDSFQVELSRRDFTRYITKSIFLGKQLWQTERLECYQYFNEGEFRACFDELGLRIRELRTLTVNYEKWSREVAIETPGEEFPVEHILILAQR